MTKTYLLRNNRRELFRSQKGLCFYCGWEMRLVQSDAYSPDACTLDHLHPRALGGNDRISNLAVCCYRCNGLKDNLTLEQFVLKRGTTRPPKPVPTFSLGPDCTISSNSEPVFEPATTPLADILGPALAAAFPGWVVEDGHARPPQEERPS